MSSTQDVLLQIHDMRLDAVSAGSIHLNYRINPDEQSSAPRKASRPAIEGFTSVSSLNDLKADNVTTNSYYLDQNASKLYVRMPRLLATQEYHLEAGDQGVLTGLESAEIMPDLTLSYGGGIFTYSAPEGAEDLCLDIYDVAGAQIATFTGLTANGYAAQQSIDLPAGFYIARLTATTPAGRTLTTTLKFVH